MQKQSKNSQTGSRESSSIASEEPTAASPPEEPKASETPSTEPAVTSSTEGEKPTEEPKAEVETKAKDATHFNAASERVLEQVTPEMQLLCRKAFEFSAVDGGAFQLLSGRRTHEEQLARIASGESTNATSPHLHGRAVDIVADDLEAAVACFFRAADELEIPIQRGNDSVHGVDLSTLDPVEQARNLNHIQQAEIHRVKDFWMARADRMNARAQKESA